MLLGKKNDNKYIQSCVYIQFHVKTFLVCNGNFKFLA